MKTITATSYSDEEFWELFEQKMIKLFDIYIKNKENVEYLTRKQTSQRLHISLPTLDKHTKNGIIKGYRIDDRILYKENEIEAALSSIQPLKYRRK